MSIRRTPWFERSFPQGLDPSVLPVLIERLRGTPARLEERVGGIPGAVMVQRVGDSWSIQENVGHLLDLEPLWRGRVHDLLDGKAELRPADLQNKKTHAAGHNAADISLVLAAFRASRVELVEALSAMDEATARRTALHPRLRQPMNALDLALFVAEHDDHHLARISELRLLVETVEP